MKKIYKISPKSLQELCFYSLSIDSYNLIPQIILDNTNFNFNMKLCLIVLNYINSILKRGTYILCGSFIRKIIDGLTTFNKIYIESKEATELENIIFSLYNTKIELIITPDIKLCESLDINHLYTYNISNVIKYFTLKLNFDNNVPFNLKGIKSNNSQSIILSCINRKEIYNFKFNNFAQSKFNKFCDNMHIIVRTLLHNMKLENNLQNLCEELLDLKLSDYKMDMWITSALALYESKNNLD